MKTINLLFLMEMLSCTGYSIIAPLFPFLGKKYNLNENIIGWMISIYGVSNTITTPFLPNLCKKFKRINILYFGTFFEATCTILYGFLQYINSYYALLIIVFFLRILHGMATACLAVLAFSIACSITPEKEIKNVIAKLEIGICLGTSIGPLFASFFYRLGGYTLPFLVLGIILYISVYITTIIKREKIDDNEDIEENPSFLKLLTNYDILNIISSLIIGSAYFVFFYPSLTNHLIKNYNMDISSSSLFFAVPLIAYFIMLQCLNYISDKIGIYSTMSLGLFLINIGSAFIYPIPPFPKQLFLIIVGLFLIGVGSPPINVSGLVILCKLIRKTNNIDEKTANDIASAMNNLSISIGDFAGPILGGFFSTNFGFKYCCIILTLILSIYLIFFLYYFYKNIKEDIYKNFFSSKIAIDRKEKLNLSFNFGNNKAFTLNIQNSKARNHSFQEEIKSQNLLYLNLIE